jgi:hypothetical protein
LKLSGGVIRLARCPAVRYHGLADGRRARAWSTQRTQRRGWQSAGPSRMALPGASKGQSERTEKSGSAACRSRYATACTHPPTLLECRSPTPLPLLSPPGNKGPSWTSSSSPSPGRTRAACIPARTYIRQTGPARLRHRLTISLRPLRVKHQRILQAQHPHQPLPPLPPGHHRPRTTSASTSPSSSVRSRSIGCWMVAQQLADIGAKSPFLDHYLRAPPRPERQPL